MYNRRLLTDDRGLAASRPPESRTAGDVELELLLLAVAEIVPDDERLTPRRSAELCES